MTDIRDFEPAALRGDGPDAWAAMPGFLGDLAPSELDRARIVEYVQRIMRDQVLKPQWPIAASISTL